MADTKTTTKKVSTAKAETAAPKARKTAPLEATIYSQKGTSSGTIALPSTIFGVKWSGDLVHQVVVGMMANKRAGTAHTKDRSEVSGGGKKPWKQKGTGRARHGSNRSPIWTGGGITFGPRNDKDYSQKINKKMRVKALFTILSKKVKDGKVLFIDSIALPEIKTKGALEIIQALSGLDGFARINTKKHTGALIALVEPNEIIEKSFANLPGVTVTTVRELNPLIAMTFQHMIIVEPAKAMEVFNAKMAK